MIHNGDCLEVMRGMVDSSVDAIVTDPPYGLAFMGKDWDHGVPGVPFWEAALRVAKPGCHLLAFGGTRTFHRLACAIEDAGWEIRDTVMWVYGSGFPKSHDVSKAIDKAAGAERDVVGTGKGRTGAAAQPNGSSFSDDAYQWPGEFNITVPATDAARQWSGWGTALKPAWEPIIVARKPLVGTVAANVQAWGTGALNIDGCRVRTSGVERLNGGRVSSKSDGWDRPWKHGEEAVARCRERGEVAVAKAEQLGRWPANLIHDGSDEVVGLFPETGPAKAGRRNAPKEAGRYGAFAGDEPDRFGHADNGGSAARFFYAAKASRAERGEGNNHPTVKPLALMRYLCRLVTPPGGLVLDPFAGSGSTGVAALQEGFRFVGIDENPEYVAIAEARMVAVEKDLFAGAV